MKHESSKLHVMTDWLAFAESDLCNVFNVKHNGRYKYKDVDTIYIVMQTYS